MTLPPLFGVVLVYAVIGATFGVLHFRVATCAMWARVLLAAMVAVIWPFTLISALLLATWPAYERWWLRRIYRLK